MPPNLSPRIEPLETRIAPAFAPVVPLSSLNGLNGFRINGVAGGDEAGFSVSNAGDVNNDGFDDLLIGAPGADANGAESGASYVVFGRAGGFTSALNLSTLNGTLGFKITGEATRHLSGFAVSGAGDVNGDGFDDLLVRSAGISANGAAYVIFGKASGFAAVLNLSSLNGSNGFEIDGATAIFGSGRTVSAAGDVNGDGIGDLLVGAPSVLTNGEPTGAGFVIFGKATGFPAAINVSTLDGTNGFGISGEASSNDAGVSVSGAGDVNGDGLDDLIIGADRARPNGLASGASYVVFGTHTPFPSTLALSTLNGTNGFKINGEAADDQLGRSVSGAGDVNGDGFDDLLIGALADPNVLGTRASYLIFGKASGFSAAFDLSTLDGANGFRITGGSATNQTGVSVSGLGDVNGDGFDDILIGAPYASPNGLGSGASYLIFGKSSGFGAALNLSTLNGSDGFQLSGAKAVDRSGHSVSGAGDINGDGFDDLLIGAYYADPNGEASGASYVVFGAPTAMLTVSDSSLIEGDAGMTDVVFTVSLSAKSTVPVTVHYTTQNGTAQADSDFTGASDEVIKFAPGETSKLITVRVSGDTTHELDETFTVVLSTPANATILDDSATGMIRNDDAPPLVNITDGLLLEGDAGRGALTFTVSLTEASGLPATVQFASAEGTALIESDYTLTPGALIFEPGETTKTISVDVLGDTSIEDHENFSVILQVANGATIGAGLGTGTILNDDTAIRISETASSLEGDAGTPPVAFTIGLEKASALPVTVHYATADATANAGSDFLAPGPDSQITFVPGELTKTITVDVNGDTTVEAHETFGVVLSGAVNAAIAHGTATGTILNDDTLVRIDDGSILEGHAGKHPMSFAVRLTAETALPVSVTFATADATATAGSDYIGLLPATVDFAPGEMSKTVTVEVQGDTLVEGSETFSVILSDATSAVIDDGLATGTILDDDVTITGKRKASFSDVDGDLVTIKVSKGALKVEDFTLFPSGIGAQLALVDFEGKSEFTRTNLIITAKSAGANRHGGALVDVGFINATGINLGSVVVKGDLGQIDAGDSTMPKSGVSNVDANSLGRRGLATQLPGGSLQSDIRGGLHSFKLADGMERATVSVLGDIDSIAITGDVRDSVIRSDGRIGAIKISGDLAGTAPAYGHHQRARSARARFQREGSCAGQPFHRRFCRTGADSHRLRSFGRGGQPRCWRRHGQGGSRLESE
jgi:hypothetical protein